MKTEMAATIFMVVFVDDDSCFMKEPDFYDSLEQAKQSAQDKASVCPEFKGRCVIYRCVGMIADI